MHRPLAAGSTTIRYTTVAECSLLSCVRARFRIGSHTIYLDSGTVSPLRLRWVKGACKFRCNLPPALLAERPGSFTCHCGNTGVKRTPNKSQHTKLTLRRKFSPRFCRDSNSQPFDHESGVLPTSYPGFVLPQL